MASLSTQWHRRAREWRHTLALLESQESVTNLNLYRTTRCKHAVTRGARGNTPRSAKTCRHDSATRTALLRSCASPYAGQNNGIWPCRHRHGNGHLSPRVKTPTCAPCSYSATLARLRPRSFVHDRCVAYNLRSTDKTGQSTPFDIRA